MVERVGEWYAFSRDAVCRRLTLYDSMGWRTPPPYLTGKQQRKYLQQDEQEMSALLYMFGAQAVHAVAPYGGRVAVLRTVAAGSSAIVSSSPLQDDVIDVYTSAGMWQTCCSITGSSNDGNEMNKEVVGKVIALAWTREDELCALTNMHYYLVYELQWVAARRLGRSGDAPCVPTRVRQLCPSPALSIQAHHMNAEGVVCIDTAGNVCGLLCGCHGTLQVLSPFNIRVVENVTEESNDVHESAPEGVMVTAIDFVPCDWNAEGCAVLYWAQHTRMTSQTGIFAGETSVVYAVTLRETSPNGELELVKSTSPISDTHCSSCNVSSAQVRVSGAVHVLRVSHIDPTQLLVFTTRGRLLVLSSDLSALHFALDLAGRPQPSCDIASRNSSMTGPLPDSTRHAKEEEGEEDANGVAEEDSNAGSTVVMVNNNSLALSFAKEDTLPQVSLPGSVTQSNINNSSFAANSAPLPQQEKNTRPVRLPYKVEWCGKEFVLLHYGVSDKSTSKSSPFSLLICTQDTHVDVRCERLEWDSDDGDSGTNVSTMMSVCEADGVRVLTPEACYLIQCVSPSLRRLCRVQPPWSTEARVVHAYQALMQHKDKSMCEASEAMLNMAELMAEAPRLPHKEWVRQAERKGKSDNSQVQNDTSMSNSTTTGAMFDCLVHSASEELDSERQALLLGAAMCLVTHIAAVPAAELAVMRDVVVHVTRQLRLLRLLREAGQIPLTAHQLRSLAGSALPCIASMHHNDDGTINTSSGSDVVCSELTRAMQAEVSVVLGRLAHCGHFQLAHDIALIAQQPLHGVLAQWCRAIVSCDTSSNNKDDDALHARLATVLRAAKAHARKARMSRQEESSKEEREYGNCYLDAALAAARSHRAALSLQFALEAPSGAAQVLWLISMGEFALAVVCAGRGAAADVMHLSLQALFAHEATRARSTLNKRTSDNKKSGAKPRQAVAMSRNSARCLLASPMALQTALYGAPWLAAWHAALVALMLCCSEDKSSDSEEEGVCGVLSALMAHRHLRVALVKRSTLLRDTHGSVTGNVDWAELRAVMQRAAKLQPRHESNKESEARVTEGTTRTREASTLLRWPDVRHEPLLQMPQTALADEVRWLRRQEQLSVMQKDYAIRYADPGFADDRASVTDVIARLIRHDAKDEAKHVQRLFAVSPRKALYATLTGHCAAGRWSAVQECLGPLPVSTHHTHSGSPFALLSHVRSFASSSTDNNASTLPYRVVVRLLHRHGQDALAAKYVPGMEADFDEKLQWYSTLHAPLQALQEAATISEAELVRRVMHRFAADAAVQRVGNAYLAQLAEEG